MYDVPLQIAMHSYYSRRASPKPWAPVSVKVVCPDCSLGSDLRDSITFVEIFTLLLLMATGVLLNSTHGAFALDCFHHSIAVSHPCMHCCMYILRVLEAVAFFDQSHAQNTRSCRYEPNFLMPATSSICHLCPSTGRPHVA